MTCIHFDHLGNIKKKLCSFLILQVKKWQRVFITQDAELDCYKILTLS